MAAVNAGETSFSYESGDASGVKVASRDVFGPTTKLAVIAKAGTRYQTLPGLTAGLEQFAFKVGPDQWKHHDTTLLIPQPSRTPKSDPHCV